MNKEFKEQAIEDFINFVEEEISIVDGACYEDKERDKRCNDFIDSLIDKIVQQTEDRIVAEIEKLRRTEPLYIGETQYRFDEGNVDWVYNGALNDLLSLITNKSDINK